MSYSTDGKCHNANAGTCGQECGKPAVYIGETRGGFRSGFCAECGRHGDEARQVVLWQGFDLPREITAQIKHKHVDERGFIDEAAMRAIFEYHNLPIGTRCAIWRDLTGQVA